MGQIGNKGVWMLHVNCLVFALVYFSAVDDKTN